MWHPSIIFIDGLVEVKYESFGKQTIYGGGTVAAEESIKLVKLSCDFDVRWFPFDEQTCNFTLTDYSPDATTYKYVLVYKS